MTSSAQPVAASVASIGRILAGRLCPPIHHQDESEHHNNNRLLLRLGELTCERQRLEEDRRFAAIQAAYYAAGTAGHSNSESLVMRLDKALANLAEQYANVRANILNRLRGQPTAQAEPALKTEISEASLHNEPPNAYEKYWAARLLKLATDRGDAQTIVMDDLRVAVPEMALRRWSLVNVFKILDYLGVELDMQAADNPSLRPLISYIRQTPEPTNDQVSRAFQNANTLLTQLRKELVGTPESLPPTLRFLARIAEVPLTVEELALSQPRKSYKTKVKTVISRLNKLGIASSTSTPKNLSRSRALAVLSQVHNLLSPPDADIEAIARDTLLSTSLELIHGDNIRALLQQLDAARAAVLEMHMRVVLTTCTNYLGRGLHLLDLFQEGFQGLTAALDRFDPDQNTTFRAYASFWINQSIQRAIAIQVRLVRLPVYLLDRLARRSSTAACASTDPEPAGDALDDAAMNERVTELSPTVEETLLRVEEVPETELQRVASIADVPTFLEEDAESSLLKEKLKEVLNTLDEREKEVVTLRFGLNGARTQTLEQIGRIYNVTRERVRQIEVSALKKLRRPERANILAGYL